MLHGVSYHVELWSLALGGMGGRLRNDVLHSGRMAARLPSRSCLQCAHAMHNGKARDYSTPKSRNCCPQFHRSFHWKLHSQSLYNHFAVAVQLDVSRCVVAVQSPKSHCTVTVQSLYSNCAVFKKSLCSRCAGVVQFVLTLVSVHMYVHRFIIHAAAAEVPIASAQ